MQNLKPLACLAFLASICTAVACVSEGEPTLLMDRGATLKAPPENSFNYDLAHLLPKRDDALKPYEFTGDYRREPADLWNAEEKTPATQVKEAEGVGLSPQQIAVIERMRKSGDFQKAADPSAGLSRAVQLYVSGAIAFHANQLDDATAQFSKVLELSEAERTPRAVWAAYMLGRSFAKLGNQDASAIHAFHLTRELVLKGLPDPLGLGLASFGEEAKIHLNRAFDASGDDGLHQFADEIKQAIALYAEQSARGSYYGKASLHRVARKLTKVDPKWLAAAIADPLVQRVVVSYALANAYAWDSQFLADWDEDSDQIANQFAEVLADAVANRGLNHVADADRLAVLAYRTGRYELAGRFAALDSGALASWVKAKLALQKGDIASATGFYADASKGFPTTDDTGSLSSTQQSLLIGERGVLTLARGEYVASLRLLVQSRYWSDTAYVAERVLTTDELKKFVDTELPNQESLRYLLARRLLRDERYREAIDYFPKRGPYGEQFDIREQAEKYVQALAGAKDKWWRTDRAQAWFEAATIARNAGMEIMGTEGDPDFISWGVVPTMPGTDFTTPEEQKRYLASAAVPDVRFHYRFIARDEALKAADLLPPRSQAFAAVLCEASHWMMSSHDPSARTIYERYVKEGAIVPWATHFGHDCPAPDFEAASHLRWTEPLHNSERFIRWHSRPVVSGAVALVVAGAALFWWRRRRAMA